MTIGLCLLLLLLLAKQMCARHLLHARKITGTIADAAEYEYTSMMVLFRNVWDAASEFMCPRNSSGVFQCSFDPSMPFIADKHYTEGNAWQWTWAVNDACMFVSSAFCVAHIFFRRAQVPGDPLGLVRLFASPQRFCQRLEEFMLRGSLHPRSPPRT